MSLALFDQRLHDIGVDCQRRRQGYAIGRGRACRRFSNAQDWPVMDRDNLRHRRIAIQHPDCFCCPEAI